MLFRNEMNGNINLNYFLIKNIVVCIFFFKKYYKSLVCNFGYFCCFLFCVRCDFMMWNFYKMMGVFL